MKSIGRIAIGTLAMALLAAPLWAEPAPSEKLIAAVKDGNDGDAVALIQAKGASVVNHRGFSGETPLTVATTMRNLPVLALMLMRGGDPDYANAKGETALLMALRLGWNDGMSMLLDSKADANLANKGGETPLIVAVQGRNKVAVRVLLAHGADPDKADHVAGYSARDYAHRDNRVRDLARLIDAERPAKK